MAKKEYFNVSFCLVLYHLTVLGLFAQYHLSLCLARYAMVGYSLYALFRQP